MMGACRCRAAPSAASALALGSLRPVCPASKAFLQRAGAVRARQRRREAPVLQAAPAGAVLQEAPPAAAVGRPLPAVSIRPGEVHVWWLNPKKMASPGVLRQCAELLTAAELAECTTSPEQHIGRERTLARAFLRSVLARYVGEGCHPSQLRFVRSHHGKPELLSPRLDAGGQRLHFNLTHTSSMIGLAVAAHGVVGLDVEERGRRTRADPLRLARRRFSQREVADLAACADPDTRAAYFLQLWTLKEAYVKALGTGLHGSPGTRSFSFRVEPRVWQAEAPEAREQAEACEWAPALPPSWQYVESAPAPSDDGARSQRHGGESGMPSRSSPAATSSSRSSLNSSGSAGSICFSSTGDDEEAARRRWHFLLLQPSPTHTAALCVEAPPDTAPATSGAEDGEPRWLQLSMFELDCLLWCLEQPAKVAVVARSVG